MKEEEERERAAPAPARLPPAGRSLEPSAGRCRHAGGKPKLDGGTGTGAGSGAGQCGRPGEQVAYHQSQHLKGTEPGGTLLKLTPTPDGPMHLPVVSCARGRLSVTLF